ncbi:MAG TPA: nucleoid-associated protein [Chloroflexi bacterium]|nr:nucleoid-associated protein [Chloroflexota bacterium]
MSMGMFRKFQQKMEEIQEELKQMTVEGTSGGGAITVVATGDQRIETITIDPSAIDPDDADLLADMLTLAVNDALEQSQELAKNKLGSVTGGLNIPGLS